MHILVAIPRGVLAAVLCFVCSDPVTMAEHYKPCQMWPFSQFPSEEEPRTKSPLGGGMGWGGASGSGPLPAHHDRRARAPMPHGGI